MSSIKKSVGKGGKNELDDVKAVQELLNKFTKVGEYSKLDVDGQVGKRTITAIEAFQKKVLGFNRPDGLVEPGKQTIKKLNENPSAVAKEAEEKAPAGDKGRGKGKVAGKTNGVGSDILSFLEAVANHYGLTIEVTSGKRSPSEQGQAMWDNWEKLKRGDVYKASTLSSSDKKALNDLYDKAKGKNSKNTSPKDAKDAEAEFVKLAAKKVGDKSKHATGRAVDVAQRSINSSAYKAITSAMKEVPEGGRTDIYHFESDSKVPQVTDAVKAKWPK